MHASCNKYFVNITIPDPEKLPLGPLKKAFHFYAKPTDAPEWMQEAYEKITKADGYIIVTPEYNGGIPAALSNMLDHFSPWAYRHRPAGILTYSIGSQSYFEY